MAGHSSGRSEAPFCYLNQILSCYGGFSQDGNLSPSIHAFATVAQKVVVLYNTTESHPGIRLNDGALNIEWEDKTKTIRRIFQRIAEGNNKEERKMYYNEALHTYGGARSIEDLTLELATDLEDFARNKMSADQAQLQDLQNEIDRFKELHGTQAQSKHQSSHISYGYGNSNQNHFSARTQNNHTGHGHQFNGVVKNPTFGNP